MRLVFSTLIILFYISAKGQKQFDSLQVERLLTTFSRQTIQNESDNDIIKVIEIVDKNYRLIADTLYRFKTLKHTIFQTIFIETNDSVKIDPLAFGNRMQTKNIIFSNKDLNIKLDSLIKSLKISERNKLFKYLYENFDHFSIRDRKLKSKAVRIQYIKFIPNNLVHVGIDIYGNHFLWTIDKTKNWDVIKVEDLWVY